MASGTNAVFAVILVPTTPVAVKVPVEALYDSPPSVFGARLPVADSKRATLQDVSVVSATVMVAGTISPVPSKDVPPKFLAVANEVAVQAFPTKAPLKFVAWKSPCVPENTSLLFVASGINVKNPVLSSRPKKPTFALEPSCHLN